MQPLPDLLPWRGAALLAEASACTLAWRNYRTLANATAVWSPNTSVYDRFGGIDLEPDHPPWRDDGYRQRVSGSFARPGQPGDWKAAAAAGTLRFGRSGFLKVGECTVASPGGGTWHTQRVGPLVSTGGDDWWALSWNDPGFLSSAMRVGIARSTSAPAVGVAAHFTGAVDSLGAAISYPPIHQHHVHVVPHSRNDIFLGPLAEWTHHRLIAIHGDWDFGTGASRVDSMGQDYRQNLSNDAGGFVKLFTGGRLERQPRAQ